jgi:HAD superfamily hydrolase (TIGR01490 family)
MSSKSRKKAAFFSIDGVIIEQDLLSYFTRFIIRRGLFNFRTLFDLEFAKIRNWLTYDSPESTAKIIRRAARFFSGWHTSQIREFANECFTFSIKERIRPKIAQIIREHLDQDDVVVIVSKTFHVFIEPLARHLQATIGQGTLLEEIDGKLTGSLASPVYCAEGKRELIRFIAASNDIDLGESRFFGYSSMDVPALEVVGHPTLVNPHPDLKERIKGLPIKTMELE